MGGSLLDNLTRSVVGGLLNVTNAVLFRPNAESQRGSDGVEFISNAGGILGTLVTIFNGGNGSTTFSSNLVVSNDTPDAWRKRHELGHVEQAKQLGPFYLATYVVMNVLVPGTELASVLSGRGLLSWHDAHYMEWNATCRMGLGNTWAH